jgi:hypothetical protein
MSPLSYYSAGGYVRERREGREGIEVEYVCEVKGG